MLTFVEHPSFTKQIAALMADDEYARFQKDLAANPDFGAVIPGLVVCVRFGMVRRVRGSVEERE